MKISKNKFTFEEVLHAYMQCRKHKREAESAMEFEKNFISKLELLTKQINNESYKLGRYKCFPVLKPRIREIWAAPFKDRIIHHLIHNEIQEEFEKHYIDQTYSCLKDRGSAKCIKDVFKGCRSVTDNFTKEGYYIKLDIKSFFVSIDKNILWDIIKEKVDEKCLLGKLIEKVIFQNITQNPKIVNKRLLDKVPANKSLFNIDYSKQGLPIGNLTSQFFSNVYLNGLDLYCKHVLKLKYYYRYADDIIILVKDTSTAKDVIKNISEWLYNERNLTVNTKKTIVNRIRQGIRFLGVRIFYHYIIPQEAVFDKIKRLSKEFKKNIFDKKKLASLNSYLGMCSGYKVYSFCSGILDKNRLNLIYDNDAKKVIYL